MLALHRILHSTVPRYLPSLTLTPDRPYLGLVDSANDVVEAFDAAVSGFHPVQDEAEIEGVLADLAGRCQALVGKVRERLDLVDEETGTPCKTFLDRWEARLETEMQSWETRRLSLSSLHQAL